VSTSQEPTTSNTSGAVATTVITTSMTTTKMDAPNTTAVPDDDVVEGADSTPAPNTDADADDLFDPIVPGGDTGGNTTSNTTVTAGPYAPQVCSTDGVREDVRCGNIFDQDECAATTYRSVRAACPVMCGVCTAAAPAAESPPCEMDYSKYPKEHVSCGDVFDR